MTEPKNEKEKERNLMATAGKILILPRGEWNANETYEMLDLVNHNGSSWLSKSHSIGIAPSDEASDYWFNFLGITINETPVANNLTTTTAGYVLDARQGKVLMDAINSANTKVGKVESSVTTLQSSLSGTQTTLASTQTSLAEAKTTLTTLSSSVSALQSNATITKGTLAVGATSIVLSNSKITTNSILSIYTSVWGVNPKTVAVASGKVTLGFDAQTVAVEVGVRVDG
jgi:hypothetical protein